MRVRPHAVQRQLTQIAAVAGSDVTELLREVAGLRLALETDLTIAAAALDLEAVEIAGEVLAGERRRLAELADRLRLPGPRLRAAGVPAGRVRLPVAALVALGAALLGALGGASAVATQRSAPHPSAQATAPGLSTVALRAAEQYGVLALAIDQRRVPQIAAASSALHRSIGPLLVDAGRDPAAGRTARQLLQGERGLLRQDQGTGPALTEALAETEALIAALPLPPVGGTAPGTSGPAGSGTTTGRAVAGTARPFPPAAHHPTSPGPGLPAATAAPRLR